MSVYEKLQEVREAFSKEGLKKTGRNDFSKYDYFELGDFLPLAQLKFRAIGLCPILTFPEQNYAVLTIYDSKDPTSFVEFKSPMAVPSVKGMNEAQMIGSAETYVRRYLYMTALELSEHDPTEDPDNLPEITTLKLVIADRIAEIQAVDMKKRTAIAEIIRGNYATVDYKKMKTGDEESAKTIILKLDELLSTIKEGKASK